MAAILKIRYDVITPPKIVRLIQNLAGIGPAVRPGRRSKKRTGQDRTKQDSQKKSQGANISPIWGEAPTAPIETKICMVGHLADIITYAKFRDDIFRGYDFTGGRISHFFY